MSIDEDVLRRLLVEVRAAVAGLIGPETPVPSAYAEVRVVLQRKDVSTAMAAAARRQP